MSMKQVIIKERPTNTVPIDEINPEKFHCLTTKHGQRVYLLTCPRKGFVDFRRQGTSYTGDFGTLRELFEFSLRNQEDENCIYEFDSPLELAKFIVEFNPKS